MTLFNGESLRMLASLPADSVAGFVTDPPYSSGGAFRGDRMRDTRDKYMVKNSRPELPSFAGDTRDQRSFAFWCVLWFSEAWRAAEYGATMAVFVDWRQLATMVDAVQSGGWVYRGLVPWNKTEAQRPQKGWFRAQCEYVLLAVKGAPALYGEESAPALAGLFTAAVPRDKLHQTEKPVSLLRWLMQAVRPGGAICDPFMGSASTGEAAIEEGRDFIGCEMVPEIFATARRRLERVAASGRQGDLLADVPPMAIT